MLYLILNSCYTLNPPRNGVGKSNHYWLKSEKVLICISTEKKPFKSDVVITKCFALQANSAFINIESKNHATFSSMKTLIEKYRQRKLFPREDVKEERVFFKSMPFFFTH